MPARSLSACVASLLLVACGSEKGSDDWPSAWDDGATEGCPTVVAWKVAAYAATGVFFSGPDPGPCRWIVPSQNLEVDFLYDPRGRPVAVGGTTFVYDGDVIVEEISYEGVANVSYETGSITVTETHDDLFNPDGTRESPYRFIFELDPRGYPRRQTKIAIGYEPSQWTLLVYDNCRIVRAALDIDPDAAEYIYIYSYDAEGHIVSIGNDTTFDYSCW